MNKNAEAVYDALVEWSRGRDLVGIGFNRVEWHIPPDKDVLKENASEVQVHVTWVSPENADCPGAYHSDVIVVPGCVGVLEVARGFYEFATERQIGHGVTRDSLIDMVKFDPFQLMIEQTS